MMRDKSMLLKLEDIIVFTIYQRNAPSIIVLWGPQWIDSRIFFQVMSMPFDIGSTKPPGGRSAGRKVRGFPVNFFKGQLPRDPRRTNLSYPSPEELYQLITRGVYYQKNDYISGNYHKQISWASSNLQAKIPFFRYYVKINISCNRTYQSQLETNCLITHALSPTEQKFINLV